MFATMLSLANLEQKVIGLDLGSETKGFLGISKENPTSEGHFWACFEHGEAGILAKVTSPMPTASATCPFSRRDPGAGHCHSPLLMS